MPATFAALARPALRQRGVAAVEFAAVVFVLLLIGAGLVEFGRALWYYDALAKGTRDAARYLSTVPAASLASESASGPTPSKNFVVNAAAAALVPGFTAANVSVACAPTACAAVTLPGNVTEVTVSATFPMTLGALFPFISAASGSIDAPRAIAYAVTLAPHTTMPYLW